MACCEFHDRLGSKLHAVSFTGGDCGSLKLQTYEALLPGINSSAPALVQDPNRVEPGSSPHYDNSTNARHLIGYGKPEYCCYRCPTLLKKLREEGLLEQGLEPQA